jgi:LmbE family N-acetylglucosaminyl deacetylase
MANVLVIAPHAMDEVLGCGGTMARHADDGLRVDTLVLFGDGSGRDAGRRVAASQAAALLGANAPRFVGLPENRGDTVPLVELVGAVEQAIGDHRPDIVYLPHGGSLHIDHQTTFRAAVTAIRPVPGHPVRALYAYEILSSTEWSPRSLGEAFLPTRFSDVERTLERKLRALDCYGAELRPAPHARSRESVTTLARTRGYSVGMAAAEAFLVLRELV